MNKKVKNNKLKVVVDNRSGFCFGVSKAINLAETTLDKGKDLSSLGELVHNEQEVSRLSKLGLNTIDNNQLEATKAKTVLFRAHGEPPKSYQIAKNKGIEIIDGTCPVVLKLQQRVKAAYKKMQKINGQVVIYGKANHAEVNGLMGQTDYNCIVIDNASDLSSIDFSKPIEVFSQTTRSVAEYKSICSSIKSKAKSEVHIHDTICRQVSNRSPHLALFAKQHDVIVFVGGTNSSNAKYLYSICKQENKESYFVNDVEGLDKSWWKNAATLGVCGATSTPEWLLKKVAKHIEQEEIENV